MDKPPPYNPAYNQAHPPPQYQQQQPLPPQPNPAGQYYYPSQPPPQHHTTVVYQRPPPQPVSSFGGMLSSLASDAGKFAGSVYTSVQREVDMQSSSVNMAKFRGGNVVQLISSTNGCCLRRTPDGRLDSLGALTDPATHFECINYGNNIISLKNMINPACHIIVQNGHILCNGRPDYNSKFRLHETLDGYMTLESLACQKNYVAVQSNGQMVPPNMSKNNKLAQFAVNLIRSVYPQPMPPAGQATTYVTTTYVQK